MWSWNRMFATKWTGEIFTVCYVILLGNGVRIKQIEKEKSQEDYITKVGFKVKPELSEILVSWLNRNKNKKECKL